MMNETVVKSSELRRSCVFCRQRKMKCSGDLPCCQTCRQREKACMYEPVMTKTRSRRLGSVSEQYHNDGRETSSSAINKVHLGDVSHHFASGTSSSSDVQRITSDFTRVGRHVDNFVVPSQAYCGASTVGEELAVHYANVCEALAIDRYPYAIPIATEPPLLDYRTAFHSIARDLMNMSMRKMNQIAYCERSAARFMLHLLADQTNSLHHGVEDDRAAADHWLTAFGPPSATQTEQMVELAFNHNPLIALIVPKTPFMRDLREGTPNQNLTWLLCAEGLLVGVPLDVPDAVTTYVLPSSQTLIQTTWRALLSARYKNHCESLWLAQALIILGFHFLCAGQCKQALAVLLLGRQFVRQIIVEGRYASRTEITMNGVQICEVDEQAIANLFWLSYVLLLWCWMQVETSRGRLYLLLRPDESVLIEEPVRTFPRSPMYKLEFVSGNLTSLQALLANARSLAVLVHLSGLLRTLAFGKRQVWSPRSDGSTFVHMLVDQTSAAISGVDDVMATKSMLASAYALSVCICDLSTCRPSYDSARHLIDQCALATDLIQGMLRDCVLHVNALVCPQSAMLVHMYCVAHTAFARIIASVQRAMATDDRSTTFCELLQRAQRSFAEFNRQTLNGIGISLDVLCLSTPITMPVHFELFDPATSATRVSFASPRPLPFLAATAAAAAAAAAPAMNVDWGSDELAVQLRARSYSDSAAIYCPANMYNMQVANAFMPASTVGSAVAVAAAALANINTTPLPSIPSNTITPDFSPPNAALTYVAPPPPQDLTNSFARPRTGSLGVLPSEEHLHLNHTAQLSPLPQSAPPSQLPLLSSESVGLDLHSILTTSFKHENNGGGGSGGGGEGYDRIDPSSRTFNFQRLSQRPPFLSPTMQDDQAGRHIAL